MVRLKDDPSNIKIGSQQRIVIKSASEIHSGPKTPNGQLDISFGLFNWMDRVSYDEVCDGEDVGSGENGDVIRTEWKGKTGLCVESFCVFM